MILYEGINILPLKIQSPLASSEQLRTLGLAVGSRIRGY